MESVLQLEDVFDCKPAVNRAFHFAKAASSVSI